MQRDEIYLLDLWRILTREWRSFFSAMVVVLAVAVAYATLATPKWEAQAWIQVGQVATQPAGQDPRPEPFQRVVERLQTVDFQQQVLQGLGMSLTSPEAGLYRGSLKVDPSPYSGLIKVSVRATSPSLARRLAQATVDQLHLIHQRLMAAPLALARDRLARVEAELSRAMVMRDKLPAVAGNLPAAGDIDATLAGNLLLATTDTSIRELEQSRDELVSRMSRNYTFGTSTAWPVYQPDRPVSPNRILIIGLGVLGGVALGLVAAVASSARRRDVVQPMAAAGALTR